MGTPPTSPSRARTTRLVIVLVLVAAAAAVPAAAYHADGEPEGFAARLTGSSEVPTVDTEASGRALFRLGPSNLRYNLRAFDITDVVQAHIHHGAEDVNGPVVAFLFGPADPPFDPGAIGRLQRGNITVEHLVGDFAGDWDGFVAALHAGNLYVNVHTVVNPAGEIRGQIRGKVDSSTTTTTSTSTTTSTTTSSTTTSSTTTTSTTTSSTTTTTQAQTAVSVTEFSFDPDPVQVPVGTTVVWTNNGAIEHTSTSGTSPIPDGTWNSPVLASGASFSVTFDSTGTFEYFCSIHPTLMSGTITVTS